MHQANHYPIGTNVICVIGGGGLLICFVTERSHGVKIEYDLLYVL